MRGLSINEPWASMIIHGQKTIEIRTWKTKYRGPIMICVSQKPPAPLAGKAAAIVELIDCRPMTPADEDASGGVKCEPGRYAWILSKIKKIKPFPIKGKLGLFFLTKFEIEQAGMTVQDVDKYIPRRIK